MTHLNEGSGLEITNSERAYLIEMRALGTDELGREVLVGLTVEESAIHLGYAHERVGGMHRSVEDGDRYLALHDKHERVRLAIIFAEVEARNDESRRH